MNSYAIVKLGSSQHKISVGDKIITDKMDKEVGDKFTLNEVLLMSDGENVTIGTPSLNIPVELEVISQGRGVKIRVHKFKAKSRYNLTKGHRSYETTLTVLSIGGKTEKASKSEKTAKKEVATPKGEVKLKAPSKAVKAKPVMVSATKSTEKKASKTTK
jgi:large subunit ribosomal protein L21